MSLDVCPKCNEQQADEDGCNLCGASFADKDEKIRELKIVLGAEEQRSLRITVDANARIAELEAQKRFLAEGLAAANRTIAALEAENARIKKELDDARALYLKAVRDRSESIENAVTNRTKALEARLAVAVGALGKCHEVAAGESCYCDWTKDPPCVGCQWMRTVNEAMTTIKGVKT